MLCMLRSTTLRAYAPPGDVDFLQDLYLKEIRSYRPDAKASKADVSVKEFAAPKTPDVPKSDINLAEDLKAYEQTGVLAQ
ncbi:hypothetical protein LPJ61_000584 [Coemansia biformis]|uniref:Uncharacterized protein n=1 Tax=Coemansia biformis TaxID=1286918 RepID=A0A9W7YIK6_9FUNG|nr:hypothetical protein LPJ61_000584 [Coemansia biformis]